MRTLIVLFKRPQRCDHSRNYSEEEELCKRSPIRRYPSELLAQIFLWYLLDLYQHSTGLQLHRGLLALRHVCRAWRAVALQHAVLSSFIPLTHHGFIDDLLVTSGSLPLHICEELDPTIPIPVSIGLRKFLLGHIERIQSAQLVVTDELVDPEQSPENMKAGESPLRSLVLCSIRPPSHFSSAPLLPNVNFPELTELSCYYGTLSCFRKQMTAPSLRRLDIQLPSGSSWKELISVLLHLPLLEELLLQNVGTEIDPLAHGALVAQPSVNLPFLRLLTLGGYSLNNVLPIIRKVSYPATVSISLQVQDMDNAWFPGGLEALLAELPAILREESASDTNSIMPHARSASLLVNERTYFSLSMWPEHRCPAQLSHLQHGMRTPGSLHIACEHHLEPYWAARLVHHMPLSEVETMLISEPIVENRFREAPRIPIDTLGTLPALTEVVLEYDSFDRVQDGGAVDDPVDAAVFVGPPMDIRALFPGVRTVWIRELHHDTPLKRANDHSRLKYFGDAFAARAAAGAQGAQATGAHDGGRHQPRLQISRERVDYCEPPPRRPKHGIVGHEVGGPPGLGGMMNTSFLAQEHTFRKALYGGPDVDDSIPPFLAAARTFDDINSVLDDLDFGDLNLEPDL